MIPQINISAMLRVNPVIYFYNVSRLLNEIIVYIFKLTKFTKEYCIIEMINEILIKTFIQKHFLVYDLSGMKIFP